MIENANIDEDEELESVENEDKLTDWAKEPTVAQLKQDYTDSSSSRDDHKMKVDAWLANLNVTGKAKPKKKKGKSAVQPKLIRKQAEWRYASLSEPFLATDDVFNIDPVTSEDKAGAKQNALVLNNQFNTKLNKVKFFDDLIRTDVDEGTAIIRVGWNFKEKEVEYEVPDIRTIPVTNPQLLAGLQAEGKPPFLERDMGMKTITEMETIINQPTLDILDYRNTTVDPSCEGEMDKAKFVITSFQSSVADLKAEGDRYKNLDKINITTGGNPLNTPDHDNDDESTFNFKDKARTLFIVNEYWRFRDVEGDGELTAFVAAWVGDVMIRMEENPYPDQKLPFVVVPYLPVRKSVFGEPDGELLIDNQQIVGAVTRGMIDIMGRSANAQQGTAKNALDITNKRRFDNGMDYEFNPGTDPRTAFHMHTYPEIPASAINMVGMQNADAESMSGVKAFNGGISGDSLGSNVGGIKSALDATTKRELGILRRLAEGVKQVGRKIISMNAEFLDEEEVIRITNEEFVTVRRDDLAGNFDLTLTISTPEADNEKAQNLSFMLQTLGNNVDPGITNMLLSDIATLHKMPALAKRLAEYKPEPDPRVERIAQLEEELLMAQIDNERAKALENNVDVELKQAKTKTEEGKARQFHSNSDISDLNYLNDESGLNRQHEMNIKEHDRGTELDKLTANSLMSDNKGQDSSFKSIPPLQ